MRKYLPFALLALALASSVAVAGGVVALEDFEAQYSVACPTVGC